jgi:hypothetical protein
MLPVAIAGTGMIVIGYAWRVRSGGVRSRHEERTAPPTGVIIAAAIWSIAYGVVYLTSFGVLSPSSLLESILDPGAAYKAKFEVFEAQTVGTPNPAIQLVTLASGFMTLLVPLLIVWWRELPAGVRVLGLAGVGSFLAAFLGIGTNQGIGYVLLFVLVGLGIRSARTDQGLPRIRLLLAVFLRLQSHSSLLAASRVLKPFPSSAMSTRALLDWSARSWPAELNPHYSTRLMAIVD